MKFISIFTLTAALVSSTSAMALTARKALDVFVPPITAPTAGTIWTVGSQQTVTWDVSDPPAHITNGVGQIMLMKDGVIAPFVLAVGFNILDGSHNLIVPNVINGSNYQVVLLGDSGNASPTFTITGGNSLF